MEGGDLRWFWRSFDIYERIDNVEWFRLVNDSIQGHSWAYVPGIQREGL